MATAECPLCAGPASPAAVPAGPGAPIPGTCTACRLVLEVRARAADPQPVACPRALAAPCTALGELHGVDLTLLEIAVWPRHTGLRLALRGPEGWLDHEPHGPRVRCVVTDAAGRSEAGLVQGGGGSDSDADALVLLGALAPEHGPWEVTVHRGGRHSTVTVPVGAMVAATDLQPTVLTDPPPPDGRPRCGRCSAPQAEHGQRCDRCRHQIRALVEARQGPRSGGPHAVAIVGRIGRTELGEAALLAIERWPGWWVARVHVAGTDPEAWGGLHGAWQAVDDLGHGFEGRPIGGYGGPEGSTDDVGFLGPLDPRARAVTLSRTVRDRTVLAVDVPLTPIS